MLSGDFSPQDLSGLGRWSGLTLGCKQSQYFTAGLNGVQDMSWQHSFPLLGKYISSRVLLYESKGREATGSPRGILHRHYRLDYISSGTPALRSPNVRRQFHPFRRGSCQLQDLQASSPATSIHMGALDQRIDDMLGCSNVVSSLKEQGTLSYYDGPLSDHRGLYVDLDLHSLLVYTPQTTNIPRTDMRLLKAGNPEVVANYVTSMDKYCHDNHDMTARINRLYDTHQTMTRPAIRQILEKWDSDQGKAMHTSERSLQRPPQRHQWTPELRNAGLLRHYWRLRLQDAQQQTNHSLKIDRLQSQFQPHNPTYVFPLRHDLLTLDAIRGHLNQSSRQLWNIQQSSDTVQSRNLYDLLTKYRSDSNTSTSAESTSRAPIVQRTITKEANQAMHAHI